MRRRSALLLRTRHRTLYRAVLAAAVTLSSPLLSACSRSMSGSSRMPTPRDAYEKTLQKSGADESALGRDWYAAGQRALSRAAPLHLPFRESIYIAPEQPD